MDRRAKKKLRIFCLTVGVFLFILGVVSGYVLHNVFDDNSYFCVLVVLIIGVALLSYISCYYLSKTKYISKESKRKFLKYWYWCFVVLLFISYYMCHFRTFLKTYRNNSYGIDQEQYILLVNFSLFLIVSIIIYYFIVRQFEVKSLSIGTKGIELTVSEKLAETQKESLIINTNLIRTITDHICNIDSIIDYLSTINYVSNSINLIEYTNILKSVLLPITKNYEGVYITILIEEEFDAHLKNELCYSKREIEKIRSIIRKDEIFRLENDLFLEFELGEFHNYSEIESIYITIHVKDLYADEAGQLIYTYLRMFEALYSKYCFIKLLKEDQI